MNTGSQQQHSQLKAAPSNRLKSSGEAAAMGLQVPCWETWREDHGETGKNGRFADEIGVAPKRKGYGFWDASCLKMQSLVLGVLRVYGLGLTQTNHAPFTKTPVWGDGHTKSCTHQQHAQGQKAASLYWRPTRLQHFHRQCTAALSYRFTDAYRKIDLSLAFHQPSTSTHALHNPPACFHKTWRSVIFLRLLALCQTGLRFPNKLKSYY